MRWCLSLVFIGSVVAWVYLCDWCGCFDVGTWFFDYLLGGYCGLIKAFWLLGLLVVCGFDVMFSVAALCFG